jgi:hypothetical protein
MFNLYLIFCYYPNLSLFFFDRFFQQSSPNTRWRLSSDPPPKRISPVYKSNSFYEERNNYKEYFLKSLYFLLSAQIKQVLSSRDGFFNGGEQDADGVD